MVLQWVLGICNVLLTYFEMTAVICCNLMERFLLPMECQIVVMMYCVSFYRCFLYLGQPVFFRSARWNTSLINFLQNEQTVFLSTCTLRLESYKLFWCDCSEIYLLKRTLTIKRYRGHILAQWNYFVTKACTGHSHFQNTNTRAKRADIWDSTHDQTNKVCVKSWLNNIQGD